MAVKGVESVRRNPGLTRLEGLRGTVHSYIPQRNLYMLVLAGAGAGGGAALVELPADYILQVHRSPGPVFHRVSLGLRG